MTIDDAIKELITTNDFQEKVKGNDKMRIYRDRITAEKASTKVKLDLLIEFGYKVNIESPYMLVKKN